MNASPESFATVLAPLRTRLLSIARRHTRNEADAADLFHDTVVRACGAWGGFRSDASPLTWLCGIMKNLYIDRCRNAARRAEILAEYPLDAEAVHASMDLTAEPVQDPRVRKALASLPVQWLPVVTGHYFDGLAVDELAAKLGIPRGTVCTRLYRARTVLAAALADVAAERA